MKYRVRIDMAFASEADARALLETVRGHAGKAAAINGSLGTHEASFCELEHCRHDEGLPCTLVERIETGGETP